MDWWIIDPYEAKHRKAAKELTEAHERVREMWTDERLDRLSPPVRSEPLYRPLDPSDVEREFIDDVRRFRAKMGTKDLDDYTQMRSPHETVL